MIKVGNNRVTSMYVGNKRVLNAWIGSSRVYSSERVVLEGITNCTWNVTTLNFYAYYEDSAGNKAYCTSLTAKWGNQNYGTIVIDQTDEYNYNLNMPQNFATTSKTIVVTATYASGGTTKTISASFVHGALDVEFTIDKIGSANAHFPPGLVDASPYKYNEGGSQSYFQLDSYLTLSIGYKIENHSNASLTISSSNFKIESDKSPIFDDWDGISGPIRALGNAMCTYNSPSSAIDLDSVTIPANSTVYVLAYFNRFFDYDGTTYTDDPVPSANLNSEESEVGISVYIGSDFRNVEYLNFKAPSSNP